MDDGRPHAAPSVARVDRHRDLGAVAVVPQWELHHRHAEHRPTGLSRGQKLEALGSTAELGEGAQVRQREAGELGPEVLVAGAEDRRELGQRLLVGRLDPADLHGSHHATATRGGPQRRVAPNVFSTASMHCMRSAPTSSSVSVRTGEQKRKR